MKCIFYADCVTWPMGKVGALSTMITDARCITRRTFMKHVNRAQLSKFEHLLGYVKHHKHGLTMASDWHVSYHKSKLNGYTVYYFTHSSIEYVFVPKAFKWKKACLYT